MPGMHCILCNVAYAYDNTISLGMDTAAVCVKARHLADQVCSLMDDAELCTSNHAAADKKCEAMPKKNTLTHQKERNPDLTESTHPTIFLRGTGRTPHTSFPDAATCFSFPLMYYQLASTPVCGTLVTPS